MRTNTHFFFTSRSAHLHVQGWYLGQHAHTHSGTSLPSAMSSSTALRSASSGVQMSFLSRAAANREGVGGVCKDRSRQRL